MTIRLTANRPKATVQVLCLERVGFSDTDAQGIVYYGRYLPYFDLARVEYERHLGLLRTEAAGKDFVMRVSTVVYEALARFDDLLEVFVRIKRIGVTSLATSSARTESMTTCSCARPSTRWFWWSSPSGSPHRSRRNTGEQVAFEWAHVELAVAVE